MLAIIGGSGLYHLDDLVVTEEHTAVSYTHLRAHET